MKQRSDLLFLLAGLAVTIPAQSQTLDGAKNPLPSSARTLDDVVQADLKPGAVKLPPTDAFANTWRNPDGSFTAVLSQHALRRRTPDGWKDLDGAMDPTADPAKGVMDSGSILRITAGSRMLA